MQKIFIKNKDLGFFTEHPITAQKFQRVDGELELVWCNHAGAYTDSIEVCDYKSEGNDWVTYDDVLVCDRCGAFKRDYENYWEDCPEEGVYDV